MSTGKPASQRVGSNDLSRLKHGDRFNPHRQFHAVMIPLGLLRLETLSPGAKLCWGVLAYHAGKNGACYPLQETIAGFMRVSLDTVKRYIKELRTARLIDLEFRFSGRIRQAHYYFLWHSCFDGKPSIQTADDSAYMPPRQDPEEVAEMPLPHDSADMQLPDSTKWQICIPRSGISASHQVADMHPPIKEEEIHLRDSIKRSKQASGEVEVLIEPESSLLAGLPSPFNESENPAEPALIEPEFDDAEVIRKALTESGVTILGAEPEKLLELAIASSPTCPVEIVAEFIRAKATEKTGDKTIRYSSFFLKAMADMPVWLNTAAGKAARGVVTDRYRNPTTERDRQRAEMLATLGWIERIESKELVCAKCSGTGLNDGKWCYCEAGEERKVKDEPVFVQGEKPCEECASTLRYRLASAEKTRCVYCKPIDIWGATRHVTEHEIAMARIKFSASEPVKHCVCKKQGLIVKDAYSLKETREYCKCRFGQLLREEHGPDWLAEQVEIYKRELIENARKYPRLYPNVTPEEAA